LPWRGAGRRIAVNVACTTITMGLFATSGRSAERANVGTSAEAARPNGSAPADYSTDVIAGYADRFIRQADSATPLSLDLGRRARSKLRSHSPAHVV
jgi:predicted ThiF/HesA family dinucleotide-utilizing enzyme